MSACRKCGADVLATAAFCGACGTSISDGGAEPAKKWPSKIYDYAPHPHIENRKKKAPKTVPAEPRPLGAMDRFNAFLAVKITNAVGTMWCAYIFAALALISLPEAIKGGTPTLIAWIAQTFLQLVLLSIIIVGQKVGSEASDLRANETYKDAEAVLHEALQIQQHLAAQDAMLQKLIDGISERSEPLPHTSQGG